MMIVGVDRWVCRFFKPFSLIFWIFLVLINFFLRQQKFLLPCYRIQNHRTLIVKGTSIIPSCPTLTLLIQTRRPKKVSGLPNVTQIIRGRGRPMTHIYWSWNHCSLYWRMPFLNCYILNLDWCSRHHQITINILSTFVNILLLFFYYVLKRIWIYLIWY